MNERNTRKQKLRHLAVKYYDLYKNKVLSAGHTTKEKLFISAMSLAVGGFTALTILLFVYSMFIPSVGSIQNYLGPPSTEMFDVNGERLYTISDNEIRDLIPISQMPEHLRLATIAIEDDQFYSHHGFDVGGIIKAFLSQAGIGKQRGGSTITQQLIKNTFLSAERTFTRKVKELILSTRVERKFSKDEILEMYLNQIPYGGTAYGVEQASDVFFSKDTKELSIAESAVLASLPKAPSYYSPFGSHRYTTLEKEFDVIELKNRKIKDISDLNDDEFALGLLGKWYTLANNEKIYLPGRVDTVLKRMEILGYIDEQEYQAAVADSNTLEFTEYRSSIKAPHYVFYIRELLEEQFGKELVESGGLKVYTTLNNELQTKAEELVAANAQKNLAKGANNMSLVSIDNKTGNILAMVGSADYFNNEIQGQNNIVTSLKQPGSSFKPFVFAKAFVNGYGPGTVIWDVKTAFGANYPNNYDSTFSGPLSIRRGLGQSRNIPSIKAFYLAEEEKGIVETVSRMGISSLDPKYDYGYPLALGTGELQQLELTHAYGAFARNGKQVALNPILRVEDAQGNILFEAPETPKEQEVLDEQAAYLIANILSDTTVNLGPNLTLGNRPAGAKTGTSTKPGNNLPSNTWTVGFTPQITTSVWSGNTDGSAMKGSASGYSNASPTWKAFMEFAHTKLELPVEEFVQPKGITPVAVSTLSGLLPGPNTPKSMIRQDLFASYAIPKGIDQSFESAKVDIRNGLLPNKYCPQEHVQTASFITPQSVLPGFRNWETAITAWLSVADTELKEGNVFFKPKPKEISDLCKREYAKNQPQIRITSPNNYTSLSHGTHPISVELDAPSGVDRVEFFVNNNLQYTSTQSPHEGRIRITRVFDFNSINTVFAKVIDVNGYSDTASIKIKIGEENFTSEERKAAQKEGTKEPVSPVTKEPNNQPSETEPDSEEEPEPEESFLPFEDGPENEPAPPSININTLQ